MSESRGTFELVPQGKLRDLLNAEVLSGAKHATSRVIELDDMAGIQPEAVGTQLDLLDSHNIPIAVIEITDIREMPLGQVGDDVAHAEGIERFPDSSVWRAAHERYWGSLAEQIGTFVGDPHWSVNDHTIVRVRYFTLVRAL